MRQPRHSASRPALVVAIPLLAAIAMSACGGGRAAGPAPAPAPAAPEPAPFAYAPGERHALFESRATVHVAGDTSAATDTVVMRLYATLDLPPAAAAEGVLDGTVDSVTIQAGGRAGAGTPPLAAPIAFTGTVQGGRVRLSIPPAAATDCDSPAGAYLAIAADLLPSLPPRLAPGDSWSETVTTTSCRGGVVLTTTASHRYVVQDTTTTTASGGGGRPATRILRTTSYRLSGEGAQAGVPVKVAGEGTGDGELLVDVAAGELVTTSARSTLELSFEAVGRVQRIVQEGVVRVSMTGGEGA